MGEWWFVLAFVLACLITAVLGKWLIPFLKKLRFGQTILEEGPCWHKNKQGTPTMGGFMPIVGASIVTIILFIIYLSIAESQIPIVEGYLSQIKVFAGLGFAIASGAIGLFDDYVKVVKIRNLGLTAKQKLLFQFLTAIAYVGSLALAGEDSVTQIPFLGAINLGAAYWILAVLIIVGMVNAVNFTDGIDGLNSSVTMFFSLFIVVIANFFHMYGMGIFGASIAGSCLGFLFWNFNPAKVFMGDTGSLFLGGAVCALAFGLDMPIFLPTIGVVYIMEILSLILQVVYFKITHGRRLFKMSPIHHHFEMLGWNEKKICFVFSGITILLGILSTWTVYLSYK